MSTKSQNVKNFVKETGVKNQLFVFAGYNPNPTVSDSTETSTNLWNYSDFSVRVGQNSVMPVIPYVKWVAKRPYRPWFATQPNTGNYYAYNDQNGYVYLCISDNINNRTDHSGQNVSNTRPTHTAGIQRYSDGYSWKPLYRITPSIERFVSSSWLPVVSFELFDSETQKSLNQLTKSFCGDYGTGACGYCAIYAKVPLNTDDDAGTNEFETGDRYTIAHNISCSECFYLLHQNEKFVSQFYDSLDSIPTSIQILDTYDTIGSLIDVNQISPSSPYYYLYQINENDGISEGAVISAFIDLSGFSTTQLVTGVESPEFTITSNSGSGARIRLKTKILNNQYLIDGIEVVEPGSGYKDITLTMNEDVISVSSSMLTAVIDVNLDTLDGLGFDPVDILNASHAMVDARLEKKTIQDSNIILPDKLNMFGLVQNPTSVLGTNQVTSGSNQNKKIDVVYRTTVKAKVKNIASASLLPEVNEIYDTTGITRAPETITSTTKNILTGGVGTAGVTTGGFVRSTELKNLAYNKTDYLLGITLEQTNGAKLNSEIVQIEAVPEFVQYTGKILSSTKSNSDLLISDTDSVVIRINNVVSM